MLQEKEKMAILFGFVGEERTYAILKQLFNYKTEGKKAEDDLFYFVYMSNPVCKYFYSCTLTLIILYILVAKIK